jgi:hypothetical protein
VEIEKVVNARVLPSVYYRFPLRPRCSVKLCGSVASPYSNRNEGDPIIEGRRPAARASYLGIDKRFKVDQLP